MNSVLSNAVLAFLESEEGGTLAQMKRFLVEPRFRQSFLETVKDPEVVYYWQKEFPLLKGRPQGPVLTCLDTFLRPKLIRYMVSQKENRLDFQDIMNTGKIFLAKLAQGAIGEENSSLLGTLLVSKIHQLAISRQEIAEAKRRDFHLYIDEFQNFITPSMAAILSGARKYHLALTLAHQELHQLWNQDTSVASAVISNPCTRICFRLGDFDAKKLQDGLSSFDAKDLQNLGIGEAICRIERADFDFNLNTYPRPQVDPEEARQRREQAVELSRRKYARSRLEVEAELGAGREATTPQGRQKEESSKRTEPQSSARGEKAAATQPPEKGEPIAIDVKARRLVLSEEPLSLGRGGQQHRYLQNLVKRLGQDRGYSTVIEKQILGGKGSVDVSLERKDRKIACEISIRSTTDQEIGNIQKCLAGGYDQVVAISPERRTLGKIRKAVADTFDVDTRKKILFCTPEEFIAFLEQSDAEVASGEKRIGKYKVKAQYKAVSAKETKERRRAVLLQGSVVNCLQQPRKARSQLDSATLLSRQTCAKHGTCLTEAIRGNCTPDLKPSW